MNSTYTLASKFKALAITKLSGQIRPRQLMPALGLVCLALSMASAQATLTWDALMVGAPSDGSGTWHGANTWFNGTADQAWADANPVVIGATVPGVYNIVLDSPVSATTVNFKTNNYTLSGSTLTFSSTMTIGSGVSATLSNPLSTPGTTISVGNNGANLTLGGGYASTTGNPSFNGSSQAVSSVNITNGTFTEGGTWTANGITINQTGGTINFANVNIGRTIAATYNASGGILNGTGSFLVSRSFPAILNVSGTAQVGGKTLVIAGVDAGDNGTINMTGGNLNAGILGNVTPGSTSPTLAPISLLSANVNYAAAAKAILNISGGTVGAKGIQFGGSSAGTYTNNPTAMVNISGGLIYLDSFGIAFGSGVAGFTSPVLNFSGATIAATANWTGTLPINLNSTNGTLTLQAADVNGTPFNITLSGLLSGTGGLIKTGSGILTLNGADRFSGATTVSNGQLTIGTAAGLSIGPVILTNSSATLSTLLGAAGQSWTNAGLNLSNGMTVDFNFGSFQVSPTVPVIQVNGDLTLDSSDSFTIEGSSLLDGTYPLMTCTGNLTVTGGGSLPTVTSLPSGVSATLTQSGKTISLHVTSSPNNLLNWGPSASGPWDFTTADWVNGGSGTPSPYADGIAVNLNDDGNLAVVITLTTNVQPASVTANNNKAGTASYTISGPGSITGSASVTVQGSGTLALATTNTYFGGTTVNSGTLAINYGGDGSGPSAIGEGTLTLNQGATIDNTSGSNVTLNALLPESWNGNFTYAGSGNLDLGSGSVTLGTNIVQVTILSNMLSDEGSISDNGQSLQLAVQGPGILTLSGNSTYSGGTILNSGKLNINSAGDGGSDSPIGLGPFTINGGTIDNTSGSNIVFTTGISENWNTSFNFGGSGNLDLGPGTITAAVLTLTLANGATLQTEGGINANGAGAVAVMNINGQGTFQTSGIRNNPGTTFILGSGVLFLMDKTSGGNVHSIQGGLTLTTNSTARVTGTGGHQIINSSLGPVTLSGGTLDLFGSSENMYGITFNSGTLQDSSNSTSISLTMATNTVLKGAACVFDVTTNSVLALAGTVTGTGSLVKTGEGALNLSDADSYSGSTTVSNGLLTFITANTGKGSYTVAGGELEAILDPAGGQLQMTMNSLAFGSGTRLGFDLASGGFGDTTSSLIASGALTMNGNVLIDVSNAPSDANDDVLLTYTSRQGPGDFVAGNIPAGAFIYDNTAAGALVLTYTQPPPQAPSFGTAMGALTGGVFSGITFTGVHGTPGGTYHILSSTDLLLRPLSAWTPVQSGTFDSSGSFTTTIPASPSTPQTFYILSVP